MRDKPISARPYYTGEIPAPLVITLTDADGSALATATGWTAKFTYAVMSGSGVAVTRDAAVDGAGAVTYVWDGTELDDPGEFRCQVWIGNGTNRYASEVFSYTVEPSVADPPAI